jgi:hypothetical protein
MSSEQDDRAKKIVASSTYGKTSPEVSPRANFACVTLVFLEDWQAGRLAAGEVCETLLAAAVARKLLRGTIPAKADA